MSGCEWEEAGVKWATKSQSTMGVTPAVSGNETRLPRPVTSRAEQPRYRNKGLQYSIIQQDDCYCSIPTMGVGEFTFCREVFTLEV